MIFKKKTKLSKNVQNDEPLARYIFSKNNFSKENKKIKRNAFMPPKNKNTISVIRHKDCSEVDILKIGKIMGENRSASLKAYCSVLTKEVREINDLDVQSDTNNNQHKRHANIIINLPNYDSAKIRLIANKLAIIASNNKTLRIL